MRYCALNRLLDSFVLKSTGSDKVRRRFHPTYLSCHRRPSARRMLVSVVVASLLVGLNAAEAQQGSIAIELNKLEPQGQGCRAYFVIGNKSSTTYQALKLDLVLFRPDGVIGRRFAVDLAPLTADKRSVKLFDIDDTACDQVGSFLINDVMECKAESGTRTDCLKDISASSLTSVKLTK
jgi:hypothetical protein